MISEENKLKLELAVFEFLAEEYGSELVWVRDAEVLIKTGGLDAEQRRLQRLLIVCSLGLWFPVYCLIKILRRERLVLIRVKPSGYVERVQVS